MSVKYRRFDSGRVSPEWDRLLTDLRAGGARFHLNSGHRSIAEQQRLFDQNMVQVNGKWVPRPDHPVTAFPNDNAPHTRTGRFDHACDLDNAAAVELAARRAGVTLRATVPGEPWHLEADATQLKAYRARRRREIARAKRRRVAARARAALRRALGRLRRRRTSKAGVQMIRDFEGCRLVPYNDPAGHATIGVGHLIHRGPVTQADRNRYVGFTSRDADKLLAADLKPFEKAVRKGPMPLNQAQFDALVSATFNLGAGVLDKGRSLGDALRSRDKAKVAAALMQYTHAGGRELPGLVLRRRAEAQPFR